MKRGLYTRPNVCQVRVVFFYCLSLCKCQSVGYGREGRRPSHSLYMRTRGMHIFLYGNTFMPHDASVAPARPSPRAVLFRAPFRRAAWAVLNETPFWIMCLPQSKCNDVCFMNKRLLSDSDSSDRLIVSLRKPFVSPEY